MNKAIEWGIFIPGISLLILLAFHVYSLQYNTQRDNFKIDSLSEYKPSKTELIYTLISLFIFMLVGVFTGYSIQNGLTKVYSTFDFTITGIIKGIGSFLLALLIHDIYFYVTHRILHIPILFKKIHYRHHQSLDTNTWSSFSFHPMEAVIQIGVIPLIAFILPINETLLYIFTGFLVLISVYGHAGFEWRANKLKAFNVFNTSLHHYQHHNYVKYNFGIYLNIWDKLFSTDYPGFDNALNKIRQNIKDNNRKSKDPKDVV